MQHELSHEHSFGQDRRKPGEWKTLVVIAITAVTMVVEIAAGIAYGSMALLADGLHMASHTAALAISALAYIYARRHAHDRRFSFGTGKVNALGGFTGAVLLALFSLVMAYKSVDRLISPVEIAFNQAIIVAVAGLVVNGISVFILGHNDSHDHDDHHHDDCDEHEHAHDDKAHAARGHHDHNLRSAYLHVLADTLTSVTAVFALLAGKYWGANWMDPAMGIVGSLLVARWSIGLMRATARVLLDRQAPAPLLEAVRTSIDREDGNRVVDLHVWSVGPRIFAAEIVIAAPSPRPTAHYRGLLPDHLGLVHVTIEVHLEEGRDRQKDDWRVSSR